jgi:lipopolysaccharide transport system permease protein
MLREIWEARDLLRALVGREIKVRYKQSLLGVAWAMLTPTAMMLVFTFVFTRVVRIDTGETPYAIFAYVGLLPWTFFAQSLTTATLSLVGNFTLVTKIYFPREVFPFAAVGARMVDFFSASLVLVGLMFYFSVPVSWTILLAAPILLVQILFTLGLALLLSLGNLFYRDVRYIVELVVMLWMFATSVIYPIPTTDPTITALLALNPMNTIITSYRTAVLDGQVPELVPLALVGLFSLVFLVFVWRFFHRSEPLFAERI